MDLRECGVVPLRYGSGEFAIRMRITSVPLVEGDLTLGLIWRRIILPEIFSI